MQALRIDAFSPAAEFLERMGALVNQIHACPRAPGVERIYLPGEIEHELSARRQEEGIPLPTTLTNELAALSDTLGVAPLPTAAPTS